MNNQFPNSFIKLHVSRSLTPSLCYNVVRSSLVHTLDASAGVLIDIGARVEAIVESCVLDIVQDQPHELVVVARHIQVVNAQPLQVVVMSSHIKIVDVRHESWVLSGLRLLLVVVDFVVVAHEVKAAHLILHKDLVVVSIDLETLLGPCDALVLVMSIDVA